MGRRAIPMLGVIGALLAALVVIAPLAAPVESSADDADEITLYFFWGEDCPHCAAAKPMLAELEARYPRLQVRSFEVWNSSENQNLFAGMTAKFGITRPGVPTFFLGQRYWVGYAEATSQRQIESAILQCLDSDCPDAGAGVFATAADAPPAGTPTAATPEATGEDVINLPIFGEVDAGKQSLALSTLLIAAVDGFNPCSLWVLSVLLALTLRTGSRRTIVVIGLVFIFVTALVYAMFIAGLFSIFSVVSFAPWVRGVVVLTAASIAAINIKDFFWFKKGVSLTIPDARKPGIYQRMRHVLAASDSLPTLIAATAVLAAGVSFVELACTAGFPVLWTNIVAAQDVSPTVFALLLGLYMLVYQLDELVIFGVAVVTLRATKIQERQGRLLKLVGGMLMLSLAIVMLVNPSLMTSVETALLVFAAAGVATLLVLLIQRIIRSRQVARSVTTDRTSECQQR
ncbi:MAG: thioredoxin family protein [Actinomycetia bacterium]|nr:thioredoxin family protein [Actinomycetes bacterium]MCH9707970.1 thioredoxin family protein [Actinomycetes bacterium]MCH9759171.1 thioredoxin family protein [Actinomycetes bacterium]